MMFGITDRGVRFVEAAGDLFVMIEDQAVLIATGCQYDQDWGWMATLTRPCIPTTLSHRDSIEAVVDAAMDLRSDPRYSFSEASQGVGSAEDPQQPAAHAPRAGNS